MSRLKFLSFLAFACLSACTEPGEVGEVCVDTADCVEGTRCIAQQTTEPMNVCMADCDPTTARLCPGGEVCIDVLEEPDATIGICYLGGSIENGGDCSGEQAALQCVAGSVCVEFVGATPPVQQCFSACSIAVPGQCDATETCRAFGAGSPNGFCEATP